ncbi:MAG TPA: hypothetical protein VND40_05545 [Nitrososphaerales archaeon]|nr:hypothetical protein [Nitrososphaerales archaeon]
MDHLDRPKGMDKGDYSRIVKEALEGMLGAPGAQAVLFYIGEPDPATFENKLRGLFGLGADTIMSQILNKLAR